MSKKKETMTAEIIEHPGSEVRLTTKPLMELMGDFQSEMKDRMDDLNSNLNQIRETVGETQDLARKALKVTTAQKEEAQEFLEKLLG